VDVFAAHTLGALMAERFETYKREVVERFYQDHFRHYSRQIVLVDVLHALLAGRDAFDDTRLALDAILESFRYGHGGILSRLLLGPHIDKVLFAAPRRITFPTFSAITLPRCCATWRRFRRSRSEVATRNWRLRRSPP